METELVKTEPMASSSTDLTETKVFVKEDSDDDTDIPSILDSIPQQQIEEFQPFHERYFEKKYCTIFSTDSLNLDTCIRVHTNKICLVYISEKHSILKSGQRIQNINFQISKKVNRLKNAMTGKGKRGAQLLQPDSTLCYIEATDGVQYPVYAGIYGKLLEINSRILTNPNFLLDDLNEGFLAIILPDLKKHEENINSLKSVDQYNT